MQSAVIFRAVSRFLGYGFVILNLINPVFSQTEEPTETVDDEKTEEVQASTYPPPKPKGLDYKTPISKDKLDKKKEDWYITGLPLVNSDPDTGVGYGVRAYWYQNGDKDSPYFAYTPYRHRVYAQFFQTTGGWQYHTIDYDSPYIGDSLWRVRSSLVYERDSAKAFYGIGKNNQNTLSFNGENYDTMADYTEAIRKVNGGTTNALRNKYDFERPKLDFYLERDLLGSRMKAMGGYSLNYVTINDYTGEKIDSSDADIDGKTQGTTYLRDQKNNISGFNGGWGNYARFGLAWDTRDFEPDPTEGVFVEAAFDLSGPYTGSDFNYARFSFSPKWYVSPFRSLVSSKNVFYRTVIAARVVYSFLSTDEAPFWTFNEIANTTNSATSGYLGGLRSLRGYASNRFLGQSFSLLDLEWRWTMFDVGKSQNFAFMLVPFMDIGQAYDGISFGVDDLKMTYGAGLRIAWNQATIIMVDYGLSGEGAGLYINFSHQF